MVQAVRSHFKTPPSKFPHPEVIPGSEAENISSKPDQNRLHV